MNELDQLIARLADLACQTVPNMRRWVLHEANVRHVRPITFCKQRLKELSTSSLHRLVVDARTKMHSPHNPYRQLRAAKAIKYALKHKCSLSEAYSSLKPAGLSRR